MKAILRKSIMPVAAMLLYAFTGLHAQELVGKLFQTKVPIIVRSFYPSERLNPGASKGSSRFCEARKGYIFQVIDIKDDRVLIRWWDFTDSSRARQERKSNLTGEQGIELISYRNTYLDYEISLTDLNSKCRPYYGNDNSFTWGALTMPIKLRMGNKANRYFSFQESLNIGIGAGWSWQKQGIHQKSRNIIFSVGVSNVGLDSLDFKMNAKNERFKPNVKSTAAMTIAAGYFFQFDNFQVGAFTGLDILPYELGRQWLHKNKPWIGVGLGMSLFNRDHDKAGTGKNKD